MRTSRKEQFALEQEELRRRAAADLERQMAEVRREEAELQAARRALASAVAGGGAPAVLATLAASVRRKARSLSATSALLEADRLESRGLRRANDEEDLRRAVGALMAAAANGEAPHELAALAATVQSKAMAVGNTTVVDQARTVLENRERKARKSAREQDLRTAIKALMAAVAQGEAAERLAALALEVQNHALNDGHPSVAAEAGRVRTELEREARRTTGEEMLHERSADFQGLPPTPGKAGIMPRFSLAQDLERRQQASGPDQEG